MRLITAFLMISLALSMGVAAQEPAKQAPKMYKWVDENGTVHYSTTPAEAGSAQEVAIRPGPAKPGVGPVATLADPAEVARCEQLRKNLQLLESDNSALEIEENGKRRPMTEEERAPQLRATRDSLDRCKGVPPPAAPAQ